MSVRSYEQAKQVCQTIKERMETYDFDERSINKNYPYQVFVRSKTIQ